MVPTEDERTDQGAEVHVRTARTLEPPRQRRNEAIAYENAMQ
jgi:hypothetical protein